MKQHFAFAAVFAGVFVLNVMFLWTATQDFASSPIAWASLTPLVGLVIEAGSVPASALGLISRADSPWVWNNISADFACAFILTGLLLVWVDFYHRSPLWPLRVLRAAALTVLPLGLEVLLFDPSEAFLPVTTLQLERGLGFSNVDLVVSLVAVIVLTSLALLKRANDYAPEKARRPVFLPG